MTKNCLVDVSDLLFCAGEGKEESRATGRGGGWSFIENPGRDRVSQEGGGDEGA